MEDLKKSIRRKEDRKGRIKRNSEYFDDRIPSTLEDALVRKLTVVQTAQFARTYKYIEKQSEFQKEALKKEIQHEEHHRHFVSNRRHKIIEKLRQRRLVRDEIEKKGKENWKSNQKFFKKMKDQDVAFELECERRRLLAAEKKFVAKGNKLNNDLTSFEPNPDLNVETLQEEALPVAEQPSEENIEDNIQKDDSGSSHHSAQEDTENVDLTKEVDENNVYKQDFTLILEKDRSICHERYKQSFLQQVSTSNADINVKKNQFSKFDVSKKYKGVKFENYTNLEDSSEEKQIPESEKEKSPERIFLNASFPIELFKIFLDSSQIPNIPNLIQDVYDETKFEDNTWDDLETHSVVQQVLPDDVDHNDSDSKHDNQGQRNVSDSSDTLENKLLQMLCFPNIVFNLLNEVSGILELSTREHQSILYPTSAPAEIKEDNDSKQIVIVKDNGEEKTMELLVDPTEIQQVSLRDPVTHTFELSFSTVTKLLKVKSDKQPLFETGFLSFSSIVSNWIINSVKESESSQSSSILSVYLDQTSEIVRQDFFSDFLSERGYIVIWPKPLLHRVVESCFSITGEYAATLCENDENSFKALIESIMTRKQQCLAANAKSKKGSEEEDAELLHSNITNITAETLLSNEFDVFFGGLISSLGHVSSLALINYPMTQQQKENLSDSVQGLFLYEDGIENNEIREIQKFFSKEHTENEANDESSLLVEEISINEQNLETQLCASKILSSLLEVRSLATLHAFCLADAAKKDTHELAAITFRLLASGQIGASRHILFSMCQRFSIKSTTICKVLNEIVETRGKSKDCLVGFLHSLSQMIQCLVAEKLEALLENATNVFIQAWESNFKPAVSQIRDAHVKLLSYKLTSRVSKELDHVTQQIRNVYESAIKFGEDSVNQLVNKASYMVLELEELLEQTVQQTLGSLSSEIDKFMNELRLGIGRMRILELWNDIRFLEDLKHRLTHANDSDNKSRCSRFSQMECSILFNTKEAEMFSTKVKEIFLKYINVKTPIEAYQASVIDLTTLEKKPILELISEEFDLLSFGDSFESLFHQTILRALANILHDDSISATRQTNYKAKLNRILKEEAWAAISTRVESGLQKFSGLVKEKHMFLLNERQKIEHSTKTSCN